MAFLRARGFDPAVDPATMVEPERPFYSTMKCTAMYEACHCGALPVVEWLHARPGGPASIRTPNSYGRTPLFAACFEGHLDVAQWLYCHGAGGDVAAKDKDGCTPLAAASSREKEDLHFKLVHWLSGLAENQPEGLPLTVWF